MTKYSTAANDRILYTFAWPTATTTTNGSPSSYSKLSVLGQVYLDFYTPSVGAVFTGVALNVLPVGYTLYQYTTHGFSVQVPSSAIVSAGRYTMIAYANPALPTANEYAEQIQYAEINDSYQSIYTASLSANISVQAAGYVGSRVNDINTQIVTGGAGTVRNNVSATNSNVSSLSTALIANILAPDLYPTVAPNTADQIALMYLMLGGLKRTFDTATGRINLDVSTLPVPITEAYFQCYSDVAGTIPATSLAEVVVQGPWVVVP